MCFDAPHDEPDDKEHEYHKQDKIDYVTHSIPPPQGGCSALFSPNEKTF